MAPVSDRKYFPSLDECLAGDKVLLPIYDIQIWDLHLTYALFVYSFIRSWRLVATALSDGTGQRQRSPAVVNFFDDDYVRQLLKDPASAFAPPNDASEKDFKTKIAPVNVTSASFDKAVLEQIKADTEWLSKTAKVNLLASLRVAVVEYQTRATSHLLSPLSSQDAANLQEATGLQNGQGMAFLTDLGASAALDADEVTAAFDKTDSRRRRLFDTLLSERRFFMMTADYANSIKLFGRLPIFAPGDNVIKDLYDLRLSQQAGEEMEALLAAYLQVVVACMTSIEAGVRSVTDDKLLLVDEVELDWLRSHLTEVVHGLSVVLQLIDSYGNDIPPSNIISQWFSLMEMYAFFDSMQPIHESIAELINPLKTLSAAISLSMLKPTRALAHLTERDSEAAQSDDLYDSYLLSPDVLEQIHKSIIEAASVDSETASPVIFAWSFLLHRLNVSFQNRTEKRDNLLQQKARENFESGGIIRTSSGRRNSAGSIFSIESSKFDEFLENASTPRDMQVVEQLAASVTTHGKVFDVMSRMVETLGPAVGGSMSPLLSSRVQSIFLELLKVSYPFVGYQSDSVSCLFSLLSPGRGYWDLSASENLSRSQDILASMINDDHAMNFYFQQAIDRYPFEFLPFISLCRTLCTATGQLDDDRSGIILELLRRTPTVTFSLPDSFQGYELVQEDENTNSFCLLEDIPLISLSTSWSRRFAEDDAYRIPAGSFGRFITDTGRVVLMDYPHSTLSLLGRQLEISLAKEGYRSELGMLQPDEIAEVISLLATLLRMEQIKAEKGAHAGALVYHDDDLMSEFSKHISSGKDILTVMCDTMDYYMQDELAMTEEVAVNILNSCIKFLHAVLQIQPTRVWSYLAKCELLNSESRAGKLTKITGSLDLVSERFDFLISSLSLFSALIDTVMSSAVQRRVGNKTATRQQAETNPWIGMSDKVLSRVSFSIAQTSVDVFENTSTWMFESETNRVSLLQEVVPILKKIIAYSFSMGDSASTDHLTATLRPAASHVIDCFLSLSTGSLRFQPILSSCCIALSKAECTLYSGRTQAIRDQIDSVLRFSTTLLRVANFLERPSTMFESYLFKSSTLLARLCAASDHYREPALSLLQSLVINAGQATGEPPSLLGYLGPQISKSFLQVLSRIGKPFNLAQDIKTTWTFFSSILRNRQQWMSNCLLTGQTPREAMKMDAKKESSAESVFATALSKLRVLKDLQIEEALVILDFVASAQNYWPWTVFTLQKDTTYMDGLRSYVRDLKPSHVTVKSSGIRASQEARVAAYIAETFAMQLYHSRHLGNAETLAKTLANDLDYYLRDGVEVGTYNKSLHNNFTKNFSSKYFGCSLENFKRTLFEPRELGENYYYDLNRADAMLNFDPGWLGKKENGFKHEMKLANANLSLVDAQIALFRAWEFLLLELSACLPDTVSTKRQMMQVAQQCLNANQGIPGPESIFLQIVDSRADLALILIQRLVQSGLAVSDANQLLGALVGTINGVEDPFSPNNMNYYRTLLKALFMVLRAYQISEIKSLSGSQTGLEGSAVTVTQTVLNVLDIVVMGGFRSLISLIHDRDPTVSPEDLALLTAILQASLSMPSIDQSQTQVLNIVASHDAVHAATSLYSWADKLADQGDPVYGELSILFLLELSTLPMLAEQLASDGILSGILSANLTKFMLRSNVSPYADAPIAQRCYGIWVKGLLPLMLNLLAALGATVAPEIIYVLKQFPHLLQASVDRFEAPGASRTKEKTASPYLTLLGTSEIHSLALLTRILEALRMNNGRDISAVEWDASGLLENVEYWLSSRRLLKERMLPLGQREMEWRAKKLGGGVGECENLLEEKIVAQLETVRDVLSEEFDD